MKISISYVWGSQKNMSKITFKVNYQKLVEIILYIMQKDSKGVNSYIILKSIFYSDEYHLNKYGRPVSGDEYIAMEYGTVPSIIYDILKGGDLIDMLLEEETSKLFKKVGKWDYQQLRNSNLEYLSESDKEALDKGWDHYGPWNHDINCFKKVKDDNHSNPAWIKTWNNEHNGRISFEDMLTNENIKEELKDISQYIKF